MMRTRVTVTPDLSNDQDRLALLWKAFEEAEMRIAELEGEADHRARSPPPSDAERLEKLSAQLHEARAAAVELRAEVARMRERERRHHAEVTSLASWHDAERLRADLLSRVAAAERAEAATARANADVAGKALADARAERARLERERDLYAARCDIAQETIARERARPSAAPSRRLLARARPIPVGTAAIHEIPGVKREEVEVLRVFGVNVTDTLLHADLGALADSSSIGAPRLWKLRALAELMALSGITPAAATRLYAAGIRSVADVARTDMAKVAAIVLDPAAGSDAHALHALLESVAEARLCLAADEISLPLAPEG